MPRNALARLCRVCVAVLLAHALPALARESVVLQLAWEHEFQFAGYYAALWQGYYAREGLDVEIRSAATPDGRFLDVPEELLAGRAQFAVGALDILVRRGRGDDLVVLAPVFQHSPVAVMTLAGSGVATPLDLAGRRVAAYRGSYAVIEARAMLNRHRVAPEAVPMVEEPPVVETLVAGKADAIVTYEVSARARARELGVELAAMRPDEFGVEAYGDTLYTTGALLRERPELAAGFTRASLEGWRYALRHRSAVAARIAKELPRYAVEFADPLAYNRTFAEAIDRYVDEAYAALGASDVDRWQRMYMLLLDGNQIEEPYDVEALLPPIAPEAASADEPVQRRVVALAAAGTGAMVLVLLSMYWWERRTVAATIAMTLLIAGLGALIEWRFRFQRVNEDRLFVVERLGSVRSRLESVLGNNLSIANGLASFIAADPDLDEKAFEAYARSVLAREPAVRNLVAAPGLVVRYVYPRRGNEAVLGFQYGASPAQRAIAERLQRRGELGLDGPVELVQGVMGFVATAPVFVDAPGEPRVSWGLVSVPMDAGKVYRRAGLLDPALARLRVAMRRADGEGGWGETFYGDAGVFGERNAVTMPVALPGGAWQIAALPEPSPRTAVGVWVIRLFSLSLFGLTLVAARARLREGRREHEHALALERQVNFDALTALPSRTLWRQQLESAIARSARSGARHALLFIDLDDFKSVNDNLGHDAGDQLLAEVARRIAACVRSSDTVARLSGDEFSVILYDIVGQEHVSRVAQAVVEAMRRAFHIGESEVFCGASIGVAVFPGDAVSADGLMVKADQAMYAAKRAGRNGWHFYTREMQEKSERRHRLYNELVAALDNGDIVAHLQPIVSAQTGKVVACEALARWLRRDGTAISPAEFVPVAEESGLINRVDFVVMRSAIATVRAINEELGTSVGLSANVSPRIFSAQNQQLVRWLETVKEAGRELRLSVEITERLLFDDPEEAHKALNDLAASGIGISIDDFGTGNASLIHLTRFPVGTIKIDRSFTRAIGLGRAEETLIEIMLVMAQRLGLKVVAEGVETAEQLAFLRERNCDFVQGYFLGRPVAGEDFREMVRRLK